MADLLCAEALEQVQASRDQSRSVIVGILDIVSSDEVDLSDQCTADPEKRIILRDSLGRVSEPSMSLGRAHDLYEVRVLPPSQELSIQRDGGQSMV